ncbi:MAG: hypothetical protein GY739_03190 [Mesoflavibacter sp.]|nr:hypothetical protein [Mesoflavibacter sp.]
MMGKLDFSPIKNFELIPTDADISIVILYHCGEFCLFEGLEQKTEKRLKLTITQCQYLAATKLFSANVARPLNLRTRFIQNTIFQYLADTEAKISQSPNFLLNAYPTGFFSRIFHFENGNPITF